MSLAVVLAVFAVALVAGPWLLLRWLPASDEEPAATEIASSNRRAPYERTPYERAL